MGKWTADYYDDVLGVKIKSLVSGAIERTKLEKTEPLISYESFVEELDAGDSFTTSVVEILVKELAERRTRGSVLDRRLIAERTAKNLRLLATPIRIYQSGPRRHTHIGRRTGSLGEYFPPPEDDGLEEDEEEFDSMLESNGMEGVRVNNLYEAYAGWANAGMVLASRSSPMLPVDLPTPPPARTPPRAASPAPTRTLSRIFSPSSSLPRPQPTRRPMRSRAVEFGEFTSRRRSSIRDSANTLPDVRESGSSSRISTRRLVPFGRSHHSWSGSSWVELPENEGDNPQTAWTELSPSSATWLPPMTQIIAPSDVPEAETSNQRGATLPRLRRGGVRAPESILIHAPAPPMPLTPPDQPDSGQEQNDLVATYPTPGSA